LQSGIPRSKRFSTRQTTGAAKIVKRVMNPTTDEIAGELKEALKG
jgi:hypothetical protein